MNKILQKLNDARYGVPFKTEDIWLMEPNPEGKWVPWELVEELLEVYSQDSVERHNSSAV